MTKNSPKTTRFMYLNADQERRLTAAYATSQHAWKRDKQGRWTRKTSDWLLGLSDEVAGHVRRVGDFDPATAELLDILHTTTASRRQAILLLARTISALD